MKRDHIGGIWVIGITKFTRKNWTKWDIEHSDLTILCEMAIFYVQLTEQEVKKYKEVMELMFFYDNR